MKPSENQEPNLGGSAGGPATEAGLVRLSLMVNVVIDRLTAIDSDPA